jgi:ATP-dependent Lhr-like helicase
MLNNNKIIKCLRNLGYEKLTDLQFKAFRIIYEHSLSAIIVAPTGSGKTEAAMLPIMYSIMKNNLKPIAAIYVTPLRALNRDIFDRVKKLASCFGVSIELRHGDTPYNLRKRIEKNPPQVLITTPETFNYLLINKNLYKYISNVKYIVLDEYRELIESKRGILLLLNIYLLERILKRRFVKVALTATLKNYLLAEKLLESTITPQIHTIRSDYSKKMEIKIIVPKHEVIPSNDLKSLNIEEDLLYRLLAIINVLRKRKSVLIFVNTRSIAEKLGYLLNLIAEKLGLNIRIGVHHGSLSRTHRINVENDFKNGLLNALIATSSMELGIDIGYVDYVIQYMSPRQAVRLVQRIGRSGHRLWGVSRGEVIVQDNLFQILESIVLARRGVENDIEYEVTPRKPLDVLAYSIVLYTLFTGSLNIYKLYSLIRDYPIYNDLEFDEYLKVLDYLKYSRLIRIVNDNIKPMPRSRLYIYRTSMIPSTRDVNVVNLVNDRRIGVLNEEYIVLNIGEGDVVVIGGKPWRIISYDHDYLKLFVEPLEEAKETIIPHWEGENIPVNYRVAREVGSVIRRLRLGVGLREYEVFYKDLYRLRDRVEGLGNDKRIVVIGVKSLGLIIVNTFGGSKINRFLRDLFKSRIQWKYPFLKINAYSTPYAVIISINTPHYLKELIDLVRDTLVNLDRYLRMDLVRKIALEQGVLHWRIYQVAQRFGAIDPEREKVSKSILSAFVDTVIGEEAFNEVLWKDYDLVDLEKITKDIRDGKIIINDRIIDKPDNTVHEILTYYGEIPVIEGLGRIIDKDKYLSSIKHRKMTLICLHCGYSITGTVDKLRSIKKCPKCGYVVLAPVKGDGSEEKGIVEKYLRGEKLRKNEYKVLEDLRKRAILYNQFGELALTVLASRGVGVSEAIRIINRVINGSDLFQELYESEKKYVKIKKYLK